MKILYILTTIVFFLLVGSMGVRADGDIVVKSLRVTYKDDITTPGKVIVRELKSLHDNNFWSKPTNVDVSVSIQNTGDKTNLYVSVTPELFYKVVSEPSKFPPMNGELRTITNKPTWVWIKTLGSKAVRELKPGESKNFVFSDLDVRNTYYATAYQIHAYAIRLYAEPKRGGDNNYSNNVKNWIVSYGD